MKKLLLIGLIIWQNNSKAQTKDYIPFPEVGVWHIWKIEDYFGNKDIISIDKSMGGDTIINGVKYIKYYDPTLKSAIRNDSVNKRVFCYDFTSKKDTLLYNFNLKVGDTTLVLKIMNTDVKYWVANIDSILLLDGKYHNRYQFNNPGNLGMVPLPQLSPLVEGLGYFNGNKFSSEKVSSEGDTKYTTVCASANKKILIALFGVPPNGEYCGTIITDIPTPAYNHEFVLYPNPTTGKFQFQAKNIDVVIVELTTVLGKKIFTAKVKNETIEIDLTNYPAGIYFVTVLNKEGELFNKKIIKK